MGGGGIGSSLFNTKFSDIVAGFSFNNQTFPLLVWFLQNINGDNKPGLFVHWSQLFFLQFDEMLGFITETRRPDPEYKVNTTLLMLMILEIVEDAQEMPTVNLENLEDMIRKITGGLDEDDWKAVVENIQSEYTEAM